MAEIGDGLILYALVAHGNKVLAEYTNPSSSSLNVSKIAYQLLPEINGTRDQKISYDYENTYRLNCEVSDEIIFLAVTDLDVAKYHCFNFIRDIRDEWKNQFKDEGKKVQNSYAMNKAFKPCLKEKLNYYNYDSKANPVRHVKGQIADLKEKMMENIDLAFARGEKIESLVGKTTELVDHALTFKKKSSQLKNAFRWQNIKMYILLVVVLLCLGIGIFLYFCGGIKCITGGGKKSPGSGSK